MKPLLDYLFGRNATLKRETVVICWVLLGFIVFRVFYSIQPELIKNYEVMVSGVFWPVIVLLAAIFGIQLAPMLGGSRQEITTRVETDGQTIETRTTKTPQPGEEAQTPATPTPPKGGVD